MAIQNPTTNFSSIQEPELEENLYSLPQTVNFASPAQAAENVFGPPPPMDTGQTGILKSPARGKVDAIVRGNIQETMKNLSGSMGKRKRHVELKKQFENILALQEKGADMIVIDAMESLGPEIKEYIPPKELFIDPKTGAFNSLEFAKRAYIGIKNYKADKAKTEKGRKEMVERAKDWGTIRTLQERKPKTREEAMGIVAEEYANVPIADLPAGIGGVTSKQIGLYPTEFQVSEQQRRARERAKRDAEDERLKSTELARSDTKIRTGQKSIELADKENRLLQNKNTSLAEEVATLERNIQDAMSDDPQKDMEQIEKKQKQILANEKTIINNELKVPELQQEIDKQAEIRRRYLEQTGPNKKNLAEITAEYEKEEREAQQESEEDTNRLMVERLRAKRQLEQQNQGAGLQTPNTGYRVVNVRNGI